MEGGKFARRYPAAANPFNEKAFYRLVEHLHLHKACLSRWRLGQVSTITGPGNVTCNLPSIMLRHGQSLTIAAIYLENHTYREGWYKLSVSYDPSTLTTSVFLHNLSGMFLWHIFANQVSFETASELLFG